VIARSVNAAADVITRAMQNGRQTPAGWAMALDDVCMLQTPETAAELVQLRERNAELERQLAAKDRPADEDPIAYALAADIAEAPRGRWVVKIGRDERDFPRFHTREQALKTARVHGLDESFVDEDVTPQVRKLATLLARQRAAVAAEAGERP
jgi:hypothetical protein